MEGELSVIGQAVVISLWFLTLLASPAAGRMKVQDLTLPTISRASQIADPEFSPDGQRIAFVANSSGAPKIWVIEATGGDPKMLVPGGGEESSPQWSPDGGQIAFLSTRDGQLDIWETSLQGGEPVRLTNDKSSKAGIRWSPDGARIAFISDKAKNQDVYVVDVKSREVQQLTEETNEWDETRWAPEWSPDGKRITFVSARSDYYSDDLWIVGADGSNLSKVTSKVQVMTNPIWSRDGKYIAFNGCAKQDFWFDDMSDIYVVEMPQRETRKLNLNTFVTSWNGSYHMYWGPDSRTLYFRFNDRGDTNIWAVNVEGDGIATMVTNGEGAVQSMAVSPTRDRIAVVRSTQTSPGELATISILGGEEIPLTRWATRFAGVTNPKKISFRTADGIYINGYLYTPPRMVAGGKYPGLVQVHGGGNNSFGNGFHPLEQYFAAKGYIVLAIEYRGSSGYGRPFQLLSWGHWAADQGWDAVAASDFLRSLTYCSGMVGIYGGSYGGIMTLAALSRDSSKFQAAAPFYGIYDWSTAFKDGDRLMRFWIVMGMKGFKPDENHEIYYRNSTINFVQNVTTPLLIEHGEIDRRAPYSQSVELVEKLQQYHKVFEFFHYPNEQHGIRQPDNFVDAYSRVEAWFEKYLKER
ncbi:MAG: LpqB family beta-propeller domain-containing protein [Candidatus Acidiferrales bacterium]